MGGTNGARRNNRPLRIEPERGKVAEDAVQPAKRKFWDILNECVAGSYRPKYPGVFSPQAGLPAVDAGLFSGPANVGAGESSADKIAPPIPFGWWEGPHVVPASDGWPVLCEDSSCILVFLHLPDGAETARAFQAQLDTTHTCEETPHSQHPAPPSTATATSRADHGQASSR